MATELNRHNDRITMVVVHIVAIPSLWHLVSQPRLIILPFGKKHTPPMPPQRPPHRQLAPQGLRVLPGRPPLRLQLSHALQRRLPARPLLLQCALAGGGWVALEGGVKGNMGGLDPPSTHTAGRGGGVCYDSVAGGVVPAGFAGFACWLLFAVNGQRRWAVGDRAGGPTPTGTASLPR